MDIAVSDAGDRLPELLDRVEQGEAVTITREGRPVATLKAVEASNAALDGEARRRLVAEVAAARKALPPISHEDVMAAIHEGRRY